MNPNDMDGHQVGNGLGAQQPNTMAPNPGSSFDAPQAPIISSSPDPEDKKESSITRAFGGRSRASKIAAGAPSQFAAQPSTLRQNAPDFFQQSMQQQDIVLNAAAEKKQKGKKGLLIGGIIGGVALALIVSLVVITSLTQSDVSDPKQIIINTLDESDVASINSFESQLLHIYNNEITTKDIFTDDFKTAVEKGVTSYQNVYNGLTSNESDLAKHSDNEKISTIINKMRENTKQYNSAKENYLLAYDAFINDNKTKLDDISDSKVKKSAQDLYENIQELDAISAAYKAIDCSNAKVIIPSTGYDECDQLDDRYESATNAIKNNDFARTLFFGENPEKIKSNIVKDTLNDIYVNSKEAGRNNESQK